MQQEMTDDLVARFRIALEQKDIAAREWQRQAGQLSASLNAERDAHAATQAAHKMAERRVSELTTLLEQAERRVAELARSLALADAASGVSE